MPLAIVSDDFVRSRIALPLRWNRESRPTIGGKGHCGLKVPSHTRSNQPLDMLGKLQQQQIQPLVGDRLKQPGLPSPAARQV
jgi:hypothetical protein